MKESGNFYAQCAGKHPFDSYSDARHVVEASKHKKKAGLDVYRCKKCGRYHIGSAKTGTKRYADYRRQRSAVYG